MIKTEKNLYFIAIVPPEEIRSEIQQFKENIFSKYGSKASLNSPPHITLHMPFDWKPQKEQMLLDKLQSFSSSIKPCPIKLRNFNCFEPRVIYVDVETNELLTESQNQLYKFCKRELNLFNAQYKELPFHPHITIAFRDLKKPMFYKAWEEYKMKLYAKSFIFGGLTLLKHDGKQWNVFQQFYLAKP